MYLPSIITATKGISMELQGGGAGAVWLYMQQGGAGAYMLKGWSSLAVHATLNEGVGLRAVGM